MARHACWQSDLFDGTPRPEPAAHRPAKRDARQSGGHMAHPTAIGLQHQSREDHEPLRTAARYGTKENPRSIPSRDRPDIANCNAVPQRTLRRTIQMRLGRSRHASRRLPRREQNGKRPSRGAISTSDQQPRGQFARSTRHGIPQRMLFHPRRRARPVFDPLGWVGFIQLAVLEPVSMPLWSGKPVTSIKPSIRV